MPKTYSRTLTPKYKRIGPPVDGCITYEVAFADGDGKEQGSFVLIQALDGSNLFAGAPPNGSVTVAAPVPDAMRKLSLADVPAATAGLQALIDAYDAAGTFDLLYPLDALPADKAAAVATALAGK